MVAGHALCDFGLQTEAMTIGKSRRLQRITPATSDEFPPWYVWLTAHSTLHGATVFLITGNLYLGLLEVGLHATIDHFKCEQKFSTNVDQLLHVACKLLYLPFVAHPIAWLT